MASRSVKEVTVAESAFEQFIQFRPSDQEIDSVCAALRSVATQSRSGYPILGHQLYRLDVGRFAILYRTSDAVEVVEIYLP